MPEVHVFFHEHERRTTAELRVTIAETCRQHDWTMSSRAVAEKKTPQGRPVPLLLPEIAAGLYPRAHRTRLCVLSVGTDPKVPLDPDEAIALRFGRYQPLRRFLAYKVFWARIPEDKQNGSWSGQFMSWCNRTECEGDHDPRILPFQIFSSGQSNLQDQEARKNFNIKYGAGARRTDDKGSSWNLNPRDFHGQEALGVAGHILRPGCHWDVVGQRWLITTPRGEWRVDGHVNIYPDAALRPKGTNVRRLR